MGGDFNEIIAAHEKLRGPVRPKAQMGGFRNALDICELRNLGFRGYKFTWERSRLEGEITQVRLDRYFTNNEWLENFGNYSVYNLGIWDSDHRPIELNLKGNLVKGPRMFCF